MNESLPELMTTEEVIAYLRLDADSANPPEQLRNLMRRRGLPVCRQGKFKRFRRSEIDAWLNGDRIARPARLRTAQRVTSTNGAERKASATTGSK